jgi:carboxylesterase
VSLAVILARICVVLGLTVAGGKATYSHVVSTRADRWESSLERDADGVCVDMRAYTIGAGDTGLLLVHGFGSSPAVFQRMAPDLAARGFLCRAMRLPGFGATGAAKIHATRAEWLGAIDEEVTELMRSCDSVWLVGHSMGGSLAVDYALANPDRVDGLVLIAPLIDVSRARSPLLKPRTWYVVSRPFFQASDIIESVFPVDVRDPTVYLDEGRDRFVTFHGYDAMFEVLDAVAGRAKDLSLPLLEVVSPSDKVVDCGAAQKFFADVSSTNKCLLVASGAGHVIPLDGGWQDVADSIERFVGMEETK